MQVSSINNINFKGIYQTKGVHAFHYAPQIVYEAQEKGILAGSDEENLTLSCPDADDKEFTKILNSYKRIRGPKDFNWKRIGNNEIKSGIISLTAHKSC